MELTQVNMGMEQKDKIHIKAIESNVKFYPLLTEIVESFLQNPNKKAVIEEARKWKKGVKI